MITINPPEPIWVNCAKCGEKTDPTMIIEAVSISARKHPGDEERARFSSFCFACWGQQGRTRRAPEPERAPLPHVWCRRHLG